MSLLESLLAVALASALSLSYLAFSDAQRLRQSNAIEEIIAVRALEICAWTHRQQQQEQIELQLFGKEAEGNCYDRVSWVLID